RREEALLRCKTPGFRRDQSLLTSAPTIFRRLLRICKNMPCRGLVWRRWAVLGKLVGFFHHPSNVLFNAGQLHGIRKLVHQQIVFEGSERTARFPLLDFFAGPVAKL